MIFENQQNSEAKKSSKGRVEALAKVTGKATYSAEYSLKNQCYGVLVGAKIASGKLSNILHIDTIKKIEGVIDVMSYFNKPEVNGFSSPKKLKENPSLFPTFYTDKIYYKGQPIAMIIAETFEDASFAANMLEAEYISESFVTDFDSVKNTIPLKPQGKERGSEANWTKASVMVDNEYHIKAEIHQPMEMHATIAHWLTEKSLLLYDKNQGVNSVQNVCSKLFDIPVQNIEVHSEFVGGGFGSGLLVWQHTVAAIMAAKMVSRPVKCVLTREQMFYSVGYRPESWQKIKIASEQDGRFIGIIHQGKSSCSTFINFSEGLTGITRMLYNFPNLKCEYAMVPLNLSMPTWMRAPGECSGAFALECAIDELSYKLAMDPVELRLKNIAFQFHPETKKPWSTNYIKECIEQGVQLIGWQNRKLQTKQWQENNVYYGFGMALGMWGSWRAKSSAGLSLKENGQIIISSAMTDIGTGTATAMQNIISEILKIDIKQISVEFGNSNLPSAPSQGGSIGLSSLSGALVAAAKSLQKKLLDYCLSINSDFSNIKADDIILTAQNISTISKPDLFVSYDDIFNKNELSSIDIIESSEPGNERKNFDFCSSAAHFCKVAVNTQTGKVKVIKYVVVADGGKIINELAAANQVSGAVVGGISMALMEEMLVDYKWGSLIGTDLSHYHFAVDADAPIIETSFIGLPDFNSNPVGSKGLGEVGLIGSAAAISNAIYHACGKRITSLPITPAKILS
ncbi:MAG: xanthine dehydrogenase family protein molybdopterin-binding subunit [Sediminibacterium sp.]|nr:xanthine dehydrogenase family protein molybdopterin-binding subunit [Sediminibacterium sp.]